MHTESNKIGKLLKVIAILCYWSKAHIT